ncbi:MAG: sulfurylase large subunit [Dehalococcoidia bacterium]|nr:sulfurylase large subunit [Dehalococcoidia bacterium]
MSDQVTGATLAAASAEGSAIAVATVIGATGAIPMGARVALLADGTKLGQISPDVDDELLPRLRSAIDSHQSSALVLAADGDEVEVYIEVTEPAAELIVVGGGHIGRSLSFVGHHVGLSVTVIDDREAYANRERFPEADRVICADIVETLRTLQIGPASFIVIVTRGHKQDEAALREVVGSAVRYIGMIGSKRRVTAVFQHLLEEGLAKADLERVHSPVGVDIGAETPEEIAVSILAEIIQVRRGGSLQAMTKTRPRAATAPSRPA